MPEIVNAITARNYELIRDRIANILAIELPYQATLNSDVGLNPTIEIERFVPVKDTELPLVNVMLLRGDYDSYTTIQQCGTYMYHIDIYTKSKWSDDDRADKLAFMKLQRLTGVIQAILSDSKYITLGFAPPSLSRVQVNSIKFADPANNKDASSSVMARLEFEVRVPETVEIAALSLIGGYDTSVIMGNTAQGYVFSGNNAPIPPFVCAPANIYNSDKSLDIDVLSGSFFEIPDSDITFGGNLFSLPATDTLNVPIIDSNGDLVANNLTAGGIEIPLLPPAPGFANIKDTDNNVINLLTVPSGATVPYNVANSEITFGTHTFSVLATSSLTVPIVDTDGNTVATTLVGGEVVVDDLPCSAPVGEGIAYFEPNGKSISGVSYADYDAKWRQDNNAYVNVIPDNPLYHQSLDPNATVPFDTLLHNNIFGNKIRFTDDAGVIISPIHNEEFYDHLTGRIYFIKTYSTYRTWIAYLNYAKDVYHGFSGFAPTTDEFWSLKSTNQYGISINGALLPVNSNYRNWTCETNGADTSKAMNMSPAAYPVDSTLKTATQRGGMCVKLMNPISNP